MNSGPFERRSQRGDVSSKGFFSMITRFSKLRFARTFVMREATVRCATEGVEVIADQKVAIPKRGRLISNVCSVCTIAN